ncbi:hypothetical protein [Amphibacillus jilinensis]|uniref:hypothetical protein n=1 Tax=Amphibacillus jilinensis TaxID=1216008 RepID=UPI0002D9708C|nr:hypothetical protein [Amphibacillus jilinensis]
MKLQNIFNLQKLYYLFFIRKVLSVGILKERLFRVAAGIAAIVLTIGTTIFLYHFFDDSFVTEEVDFLYYLIQMQSLNIIVWTAVSFLLIKMLFLKRGSFLKITSQLPVTNQERSVSFLLFELIMSLTVIASVSLSYIIAILLRSSFSYLTLLICIIAFNSIIGHLFLQLLYVLVIRILELLKLTKLKSFISLLLFTGLLYFLYRDSMNAVMPVQNLGDFRHWSQGFVELHNMVGFTWSALVFALLSVILIFTILHIPNELHTEDNLYIKLKLPLINVLGLLNIYFMQLTRRVENYVTVTIVYCLSAFFLLSEIMNPLHALFLNVTTGLYMYSQTDRIRIIYFQLKYSAIKDYSCMIFSQFLFLLLISVPILMIQLFFYQTIFSINETLSIFLSLFLANIFSTLIGILFPGKKENPFSPFVGVLVMVIIAGAMTLLLQFLGLSEIYNQIIMGGIYLFMVYVSWVGLEKLKEEVIYAKNQTNL